MSVWTASKVLPRTAAEAVKPTHVIATDDAAVASDSSAPVAAWNEMYEYGVPLTNVKEVRGFFADNSNGMCLVHADWCNACTSFKAQCWRHVVLMFGLTQGSDANDYGIAHYDVSAKVRIKALQAAYPGIVTSFPTILIKQKSVSGTPLVTTLPASETSYSSVLNHVSRVMQDTTLATTTAAQDLQALSIPSDQADVVVFWNSLITSVPRLRHAGVATEHVTSMYAAQDGILRLMHAKAGRGFVKVCCIDVGVNDRVDIPAPCVYVKCVDQTLPGIAGVDFVNRVLRKPPQHTDDVRKIVTEMLA